MDVWPSVVERFFNSKNSPAPVITLVNSNSNRDVFTKRSRKSITKDETTRQSSSQVSRGSIFSAMPSYQSVATVILKYLRKMKWEFINVVLDETV